MDQTVNQENIIRVASGYLMLIVLPLVLGLTIWGLVLTIQAEWVLLSILLGVAVLVEFTLLIGFFMVNPNQAKVLQLFGDYRGTVREPGLKWANPFYTKVAISTRVRNFESEMLKVNDASGNPIEIACVVVWKVVDTAEALFDVDDYESFVRIQSESALRNMTSSYPYEKHDSDELTLRSDPITISDKLTVEVQDRLDKAGVNVLETRISHLAYAPEIANAMLRRQQAEAIVAARTQIVDGAVGMVDIALQGLKDLDIVNLDEERKAAMVANLLVVLCGEENARPVINTGTLYGG